MGSSKKHKERDREKEHKHKRKHRHRSHSRSPSSKRKKEDKPEKRKKKEHSDRDHRNRSPEDTKEFKPVDLLPDDSHTSGGEKLSLSIADTNKIRAKLGLKPLDEPGATVKDETKTKQEDVHAPPENISAVKKTQDLREKMAQMREKRRINMMLGKVKKLAESDSDDETLVWVQKSRKNQQAKERAAKQAKMLEEMDAEFGIGDLVAEEFGTKKKYTSRDLSGINVQHGQDSFKEGKTVILTLQDKGVLDEDNEDTLINVNMIDDEIAAKNTEVKKKKPDYNPYDDGFDEYGVWKEQDVLSKYDEEIQGQKKDSFKLGSGGRYNTEQERRLEEIKQDIQRRGESLTLPAPQIAAEYYSTNEMASFNKIKKKTRKLRKKAKLVTADDLLPLEEDLPDAHFGSRIKRSKKVKPEPDVEEGEVVDTDIPRELIEKTGVIPGLDLVDMEIVKPEPFEEPEILGPEEDLTGVKVEEDMAGFELESVLKKARRLKQKKEFKDRDKKLADTIKQEPEDMTVDMISLPLSGAPKGAIVLNATSEFCRSLGEVPSYGKEEGPEEEDEIMEFERELVEQRKVQDGEEEALPGWQSVEIDSRPVEIEEEKQAVLDDEPIVSEGLAAALSLANKKGYLENENKKSVTAPKHMGLESKNYSIEDKRYDDLDEKFRKRDRYQGGMVSDFKDKMNYKPDVKLEYIDEGGYLMNAKEAFRYLSHRFHGKGSGKKKTEKRQKKQEEEQLMKSMSSTDTPLNTVALLTEKQKVEKTPYIVLSGGGKAATSLSK